MDVGSVLGRLGNGRSFDFVPKGQNADGKYAIQVAETVLFQKHFTIGDAAPSNNIMIEGRSVTIYNFPRSMTRSHPMTVYTWTSRGLRFALTAEISGLLTEPGVEHMIKSIVQ